MSHNPPRQIFRGDSVLFARVDSFRLRASPAQSICFRGGPVAAEACIARCEVSCEQVAVERFPCRALHPREVVLRERRSIECAKRVRHFCEEPMGGIRGFLPIAPAPDASAGRFTRAKYSSATNQLQDSDFARVLGSSKTSASPPDHFTLLSASICSRRT